MNSMSLKLVVKKFRGSHWLESTIQSSWRGLLHPQLRKQLHCTPETANHWLLLWQLRTQLRTRLHDIPAVPAPPTHLVNPDFPQDSGPKIKRRCVLMTWVFAVTFSTLNKQEHLSQFMRRGRLLSIKPKSSGSRLLCIRAHVTALDGFSLFFIFM